MRSTRNWLRELWYGDVDASDVAMQGEHRLARYRVALIIAPTLFGLTVALRDPGNVQYSHAVPVNLACLLFAIAALFMTRRGQRPTWLGTATALGDVSLVSLLHVLELLQHTPSAAVNGRITFAGYFFALLGTCVRWDRRIAVGAGLVAAVQYAAIAAAAARAWPGDTTIDVAMYGQFDWGVQGERVLTLALFGVVCGAVAQWAVRLREYATTDQLTGLMNRRTFEERLRDELIKASRAGSALSVVMMDLDRFKQVNDQHGHQAGDVVLRAIADVLRGPTRRTDLVGRWGGEEFILACLGATVDEASQKAELLRDAVEGAGVNLPDGGTVGVTLSAGVATASAVGYNLEALVRSADQHLLLAKREGRNRVVTGEHAVVR
jgi:diguanylate cyclase (GGDEF)-like protein